jgi:glyoxylase-like metal-dependent hydrolase (beta-lactamase superfamily II)
VWLVGDDDEVVIVDAAHTADRIVDAVAGRNIVAVIVTHGHDDHVTVALELASTLDAPVLMHSGGDMLWKTSHIEQKYWNLDAGRQRVGLTNMEIQLVHSPGHSPGSVCPYVPEADVLTSGDTLFNGGPGATGR